MSAGKQSSCGQNLRNAAGSDVPSTSRKTSFPPIKPMGPHGQKTQTEEQVIRNYFKRRAISNEMFQRTVRALEEDIKRFSPPTTPAAPPAAPPPRQTKKLNPATRTNKIQPQIIAKRTPVPPKPPKPQWQRSLNLQRKPINFSPNLDIERRRLRPSLLNKKVTFSEKPYVIWPCTTQLNQPKALTEKLKVLFQAPNFRAIRPEINGSKQEAAEKLDHLEKSLNDTFHSSNSKKLRRRKFKMTDKQIQTPDKESFSTESPLDHKNNQDKVLLKRRKYKKKTGLQRNKKLESANKNIFQIYPVQTKTLTFMPDKEFGAPPKVLEAKDKLVIKSSTDILKDIRDNVKGKNSSEVPNLHKEVLYHNLSLDWSQNAFEIAASEVLKVVIECFWNFEGYREIFFDFLADFLPSTGNTKARRRPSELLRILYKYLRACEKYNQTHSLHCSNLMFALCLLRLLRKLTSQDLIKVQEDDLGLYIQAKLENKWIALVKRSDDPLSNGSLHHYLILLLCELLQYSYLNMKAKTYLRHADGYEFQVGYKSAKQKKQPHSIFFVNIRASKELRTLCRKALSQQTIDWPENFQMEFFDVVANVVCENCKVHVARGEKMDFSPGLTTSNFLN